MKLKLKAVVWTAMCVSAIVLILSAVLYLGALYPEEILILLIAVGLSILCYAIYDEKLKSLRRERQ